jgi:fucose permease
MARYFIEARDVSDKFVLGLLASVPLWGGALGGIAGGFINDGLIAVTANRRLSRSIVGFSGKTIACVCLYLSITHPEPMVGASLLFATKFFSDWSQPTVWGTSTDMGGRYSATVFSVINSAGSVGGVVTPLLGGFLLDRYATQSDVAGKLTKIVHYEPVFIMVGIMYLMSATCWLFIDCTNSLDRPEYTGTVDGDGTDGEPVM